MSWRIDDFVCQNADCDQKGKTVEKMYKPTDKHPDCHQTCDECNHIVRRMISGLKTRHISWSLWRV